MATATLLKENRAISASPIFAKSRNLPRIRYLRTGGGAIVLPRCNSQGKRIDRQVSTGF